MAPVRPWERATDGLFRGLSGLSGLAVVAVLVVVVGYLFRTGYPAWAQFGVKPLLSTDWDPLNEQFGILGHIWGTVFSSLLALAGATLFGVAVAVLVTQEFLPRWLAQLFRTLIELLAAIPSIVYGLWGLEVLVPALRPVGKLLHDRLGFVPLFSTPYIGPSVLPASLVLAVMILPTISAVAVDALLAVPKPLRDGALALGATKWETILRVVLPTARAGVLGAVVLGLGRALGETMALTLLIGNQPRLTWSLLSPADTLTALLANSFAEADDLQMAALMVAAMVLLAITLAANVLGTLLTFRRPVAAGNAAALPANAAPSSVPEPQPKSEGGAVAALPPVSEPPSLRRRWGDRKGIASAVLTGLTLLATLLAVVPLGSVLYMLLDRGGRQLTWPALTTLPPAANEAGGGFGNAIVGTLIMTGLAAALAVPMGLLAAVYLSEIARPNAWLATALRFAAKVLTGLPSILAGVFAYTLVVLTTKTASPVAGAVALSLLMLPVVVLAGEQALRAVPGKLREAAVGAGATRTQVVLRVVLPTAWPGLLTGVLLATARAAGEAAPLLFTARESDKWFRPHRFMEDTAAMSTFINKYARQPDDNQVTLAWACAFVLVMFILALNLLGRGLARWASR